MKKTYLVEFSGTQKQLREQAELAASVPGTKVHEAKPGVKLIFGYMYGEGKEIIAKGK